MSSEAYKAKGRGYRETAGYPVCWGCYPPPLREEDRTRIAAAHPDWSEVRIRVRGIIEALKTPLVSFPSV